MAQICIVLRREVDRVPYTENTSVEFKSRGQVSREAGFSVEAGQFFSTRPAIDWSYHDLSRIFRHA